MAFKSGEKKERKKRNKLGLERWLSTPAVLPEFNSQQQLGDSQPFTKQSDGHFWHAGVHAGRALIHKTINLFLKRSEGWSDGSVVKSIGYSQHPQGVFSTLHRHKTHIWYTDTVQAKHPYLL